MKSGLQKSEENAKEKIVKTNRNNPFSDEDIINAWNAYISSHPTEHILINTMRSSRPTRVDNFHFAISVENPGQLDLMNNAMTDIIANLSNQLSNDFISFEINLNQGEASPHVWNAREVLAHMIEDSPNMKKFIEQFNLSIS